jgi:hypothetical protein
MLIGIDQSLSSTGVCAIDEDTMDIRKLYVVSAGNQKRGAARLDEIIIEMEKALVNSYVSFSSQKPVDKIFIAREDYAYQAKGHVFQLGEIGGCINMSLYRMKKRSSEFFPGFTGEISLYIIPISSWKGYILNETSPKDSSYLLKVMKTIGISFDNDNVADAYMLVRAAWELYKIAFLDGDMHCLTGRKKYFSLSPSIRKENKITERNITALSEDDFKKYLRETIGSHRMF